MVDVQQKLQIRRQIPLLAFKVAANSKVSPSLTGLIAPAAEGKKGQAEEGVIPKIWIYHTDNI